VDKYTWVDIGSSYLPSDLLTAFLYAQLEKLDEIQNMRMNVWNAYYSALKPFEDAGKIRLPIVPDYAQHNAHLFYVLFKDELTRDRVMNQMKGVGIYAVFHYVPLHSSPVGLGLGNRKGDLLVTEEMSGRLLRLPMYAGISDAENNYTISKVKEAIR
jgi:dTDP-4-amino-4,6-dideoxygalactose transaminase